MALPRPAVAIDGGCSAIQNNTLFVYSSKGFQELALEKGTKWKKLKTAGVAVEGAVCVGTKTDLYVIGGEAINNKTYRGLQKYSYSSKKWTSIDLPTRDLQNRRWHSAAYLEGADTVVVYAGTQGNAPALSSATFTFKAKSPTGLISIGGSTAVQTAIAPILLRYSPTQAVMLGGHTATDVMLVSADGVWSKSNTTLAAAWPTNVDRTIKASIISGSDGSMSLYSFDMSTSPATVNRTLLLGVRGAGISASASIRGRKASLSRRSTKDEARDELTAKDWPSYDSKSAPSMGTSDYTLATDSNGLVVFAGGSEEDNLGIFNGKQNSWVNATAKLVDNSQVLITSQPTSTSGTTPSQTSGATETSSGAPPSTPSGMPATTVLGIVLGVIFGLALILVVILFFIKRIRPKQTHVEGGRNVRDLVHPTEKPSYLTNEIPVNPPGFVPGHKQKDSQNSFSSVAILMGKVGKVRKSGLNRNVSNGSKRSSVSSIVNRQFKNMISRPQLQPQTIPEPSFEVGNEKSVSFAAETAQPKPRAPPLSSNTPATRRSSGWNRYWSGGSSLNILGFGSGNRRETQNSEYTTDSHRITRDSATMPPPLQLHDPTGFQRVNSGSPHYMQSTVNPQEGLTCHIERPLSNVSSSGYSSGIPQSIHDDWDPTWATQTWKDKRATNNHGSLSLYPTPLGAPRASRPPTGISQQPQLAHSALSSDLSWLNIGQNNRSLPPR